MYKVQFVPAFPAQLVAPVGLADDESSGYFLAVQQWPNLSGILGNTVLVVGAPQVVIAAPTAPQQVRLFRYHMSIQTAAAAVVGILRVQWSNGNIIMDHNLPTGIAASLNFSVDFSPFGIEGGSGIGVQLLAFGTGWTVSTHMMYSLSIA